MKKTSLILTVSILCFASACNSGNTLSQSEINNASETLTEVSNEVLESAEQTATQYSVRVSRCSEGGSVTVDKELVANGESVIVTVTEKSGYYISDLRVNGVQKVQEVADGKLLLENVGEHIRIVAEFEAGIIYIAETQTPQIDGEIDEVWSNAATFYTKNVKQDKGNNIVSEEPAQIKAMWNETGFYFLGCVYDSLVVETDRCNLWVSETYTTAQEDYSADATKGNYAICINPEAKNLLYTDMDISKYWTAAATETEDGYVVEIFVPVLGTKTLQVGNYMGFDISVDYYSYTEKRDFYAYCYGLGRYWDNVGALKAVKLLP